MYAKYVMLIGEVRNQQVPQYKKNQVRVISPLLFSIYVDALFLL